MTREDLIGRIHVTSPLMAVIEEFDIRPLDVEEIEKDDYLKVAEIVFGPDSGWADSELTEIVEHWIELCVEDIAEEDSLTSQNQCIVVL